MVWSSYFWLGALMTRVTGLSTTPWSMAQNHLSPWEDDCDLGPAPPNPLPFPAGPWLKSSWECPRFFWHHQTASSGKHAPVINLNTRAERRTRKKRRRKRRGTQRLPSGYILESREVILRSNKQLLAAKLQNMLAANSPSVLWRLIWSHEKRILKKILQWLKFLMFWKHVFKQYTNK